MQDEIIVDVVYCVGVVSSFQSRDTDHWQPCIPSFTLT